MKFATTVVRAGISPDPSTGAILPPIYETATYVLEEVGKKKGFDYTRSSNPTRAVLEANLAAIEGGKYGVAFASGMSTVDAVMRLFSAGDHFVSTDNVYGGVTRLFDKILSRYGLSFTYVDTSQPEKIVEAIRPNTKMIWVETPTNPLLKITDVEAVSKIAKEHNLLFGIDPTFASPYLLRTMEWEVDLVVQSTSKYLSGHNQLIGGIAITNNEDLYKKLKFIQKSVGAVPSPFDCWLTLMGVKTLPLRMDRHCSNAMAVAQFLDNHPKVERVIYPGLPSHPQHEIARRQMKDFGGIVSFELKGDVESGITLMNNIKLCSLAENLGAVETLVTHPVSMTHTEVPKEKRLKLGLTDSMIRISVGIEDVEDIIADLEQALQKVK